MADPDNGRPLSLVIAIVTDADVISVINDVVERHRATDDGVVVTSNRRDDVGGVTAHRTQCHGRRHAPRS